MNKILKLIAGCVIAMGLMTTVASADAAKGQKYYLKTLKKFTGANGTKFAAMHTQAEWEELFANNGEGFIKEFSKEYPDSAKFISSDKFKDKIMPHIKDFAIKYARDSGNVPSC